ncbi:type II toxin-antitoxin system HigB family toxin [Dyadobacter sp. MSC1_007]|uniref:type II toxin-antitoxin system HigB family toxin n=1 Tax=Dyadobacter sp. MSC1_007 TaxID=2909264 RepID=UPI00202ECC53|nr:type II toxin-antitoxin system HigB family toxin [Dyadobacter sp. MSC1_007]
MVVISKSTLNHYVRLHPRTRQSLEQWYRTAKKSQWSCHSELKKSYNSADYVGNDRYVFNINGNEHRLIAMVHFDRRTIYIVFLGTHSEYDRINASTINHKRSL